MTSPARTMNARQWALLFALSVLWGGSYFFIAVALRELAPFTLVTLRLVIAAAVLGAAVAALGLALPRTPAAWRTFAVMGLLNNVLPFCLIGWAQTRIPSGLAAILNATTPLWTVVAAHLVTADERMTGRRLAGVLVGLAGVAVTVGPAALAGLGRDTLAQLTVLGGSLAYASAGLYGRRLVGMGVAPMVSAAGQVTAAALLLAPLALAVDRPWLGPLPGLSTWSAVVGLATLSTALAYVLYFRLLASAGATNLMLVTFLIPATAILLGALVLGERLAPRQFAGMALIAAGLAVLDGRLLRRWTRSAA